MKLSQTILMASAAILLSVGPSSTCHAYMIPRPPIATFQTLFTTTNSLKRTFRSATTVMMTANDARDPTNFREAEVLGLRLMQEGNFEEALVAFQKGMKLPGSRPDVLRTKALSGPSPVGGAFGGTESLAVMTLDDFELQAAHYNMACAHSRLGNLDESIANLAKAFENGFDNFSTVHGDPDLDPVKGESAFEKLMDAYETKGGFNPFGLFGGNNGSKKEKE